MTARLFLIRHGQTNWNLNKRYCGFADINLNEKGKIQAKCLRNRLKKEKVHNVYSSDRKRAMQTAKIIFKKIEIKKISNLRELNFGVFEGLTYKEIMQRHAEIYRKWLDDPFRTRIPGGEDLNARRKRVVKAFKKIISYNSGKTIAVISHGGVISIFINAILKSKEFWKFIPKLGSISIVEAKNGKLKVSLFNDTKHLNG